MAKDSTKDTLPARCLNCRGEVLVPNTFADGDTIECGTCGMSLRILRGGGALRLVVADLGPLRDELKSTQQRVQSLEADLARARASLGIGVNGFGLGVLYVIVQIFLEEKMLSPELIRNAIAIGILTGVGLELANFLFLAKRREMARLSGEIGELQTAVKEIQRKIRESARR